MLCYKGLSKWEILPFSMSVSFAIYDGAGKCLVIFKQGHNIQI